MENRIQYQFSAGTAGFDKAVSSIEGKMREARTTFNREIRAINTDMMGTQTRLTRLGGAANDAFSFVGSNLKRDLGGMAASVAAVFSVVAIKNFTEESKKAALEQGSAMRGLESIANHAGIGIGAAMREAELLAADGLMTVTDSAKALQNLLSRGYDVDQAVTTINRLKDAAAFNRQAHLGMSEAVLTATEGLKNENSILVDNAGVTKNVSRMWVEYAKSIGTTRDKLTQSQKVQAEYVGILGETEAMLGNAKKASEGLVGSQASLDKSSNDLKVTVGTALEPAFVSLNQTLSETASWLNDLIRSFSGLHRGIPEIETDIAALEARLEGMTNRRTRGISKGALASELEGLRAELQGARLASQDADQISAGISELTARIATQQARVSEAAAGGNTDRFSGSGRNRGMTAYGQEMAALEALQAQMRAAQERRQSLLDDIKDVPQEEEPSGAGNSGTKSRTSQWSEALDAQKVAHAQMQAQQGTYFDFSAAQEAEYWNGILQRTDLSAAERLSVQRNYLAALQASRRQDEGQAFADLQAQAQQYRNNMDARLQIAQQTLQRSAQLYGTDSQEYQRAAAEVVAIEREKQQQLQELKTQEVAASKDARLADIAHAQQMAELAVQQNLLTQQQMLAKQREFEDLRYAVEQEALERRKQLLAGDPDRDPVALQGVLDEMAQLQQAHQNQVAILAQQQAIESRTNWTGMMDSLQGTWESGLNGMLTGTMSTKGLLDGIYRSIYQSFVQNMVTKPLMNWLFAEEAKTAATVTGVAVRGAAEEAGAVKSVVLWAGAAIKNILTSGYQAMAGAFAAMSAIPIIGPILGAAAAIAAGAFVFGLVKNVASAEGGYDIPAGTNPMTQLHEQEMVLPKQYANVIRQAADGGGSLGGGGDSITYNDHSGRLTASDIRRNVGVIATELARLRRNNGVKA
ncbi:MAG: hypothetical protein ACKVK5_10705 [Pseudomonadales bacterium]